MRSSWTTAAARPPGSTPTCTGSRAIFPTRATGIAKRRARRRPRRWSASGKRSSTLCCEAHGSAPLCALRRMLFGRARGGDRRQVLVAANLLLAAQLAAAQQEDDGRDGNEPAKQGSEITMRSLVSHEELRSHLVSSTPGAHAGSGDSTRQSCRSGGMNVARCGFSASTGSPPRTGSPLKNLIYRRETNDTAAPKTISEVNASTAPTRMGT